MFETELKFLLKNRLKTQQELLSLNQNIKSCKTDITELELQIKIDFNASVDKNDPRYSNAEKRRVELENKLKSCEGLTALQTRLDKLEIKLAQEECKNNIEKLQERYLFKQIDIYIVETGLNHKKEIK